MPNEKTTEVTEGGTKRGKARKDGDIAKGGIISTLVATVGTAAVVIGKAIKDDKGKTILKIGKLVIKWFPK